MARRSAVKDMLAQEAEVVEQETILARRDIQQSAESQRALAEVQGAMAIAKKFPRSETVVLKNMYRVVGRISFAEKAYYSYPRGDAEVSGPSIYFAREMARYWGNLADGFKIIHDDEEKITLEGYAVDLETNTWIRSQSTFAKLIFRKKSGWIKPDERELRELIGKHAAIQVRNCLLQLFPRDITEDLIETAKDTVKKGMKGKDIRIARAEILEGFERYGYSKADIEDYIKCKMDDTTGEQLVELKGLLKSIADGVVKPNECFGKAKEVKETKGTEKVDGELSMDNVAGKKGGK